MINQKEIMGICIYNTLTGKKEEFKPITKGKVGIYVCGVTVYDECHIGHLRGAFTFDIIRRYFEFKGYRVKYVRNITDIDDKIIDKARKGLRAGDIKDKVKKISECYTESYYRDMEAFEIKKADIEPRATGHINDMIGLIKKLVRRGYAYEKDGNVYFDVRKFKEYGKLSGQSLEKIEEGARVEIDKKKDDPLDFALWKSSKENEPYWDSPWGQGRPGWHIECSSMSMKYLGENFDIHGGGRDLVFPHHENEIAQSECATGKNFANYWMHNGLLTINGAKMAKSLGNFVSIKDIVKKFHPEVLKIFFLSSHYTSPVDFTFEKMEEAKKARERFYILLDKIERLGENPGLRLNSRRNPDLDIHLDILKAKFEEAMDDDFNTAEALATLFELVTYVNKNISDGSCSFANLRYAEKEMYELGTVIGLFGGKRVFSEKLKVSEKEIKKLIDLRNKAREKKDFKAADKIRKELGKKGIILEDERYETTWRVK